MARVNHGAMLSREAQLLLVATQGEAGHALNPLPNGRPIDWTKLAVLARQQGATAVLWQWLRRSGAHAPPRDIAQQWQKLAMVAEFQLLQLERLLHEVLDLFEAHGIETMLLKGSALAYTNYGGFAGRPMADLDLLVRRDRAEEAWVLLQANGWTWLSGQLPAANYTAHQHLPPLVAAAAGGHLVEIHSALLPAAHPFRWSVDGIWNRGVRISAPGRQVLVPHPIDQLLHACIHFTWSHEMRWGGWRALRDIAVIARAGTINWPAFVEAAIASRAATCCFWMLRLARDLTGAPIPEDVMRALRPRLPEFVLQRLERHAVLQLSSTDHGSPSKTLSNVLWEIGIAPRRSGHGGSRPWHVSEPWNASANAARPRPDWLRWTLQQARHAASVLGYLWKITAARLHDPV